MGRGLAGSRIAPAPQVAMVLLTVPDTVIPL